MTRHLTLFQNCFAGPSQMNQRHMLSAICAGAVKCDQLIRPDYEASAALSEVSYTEAHDLQRYSPRQLLKQQHPTRIFT
jgi:hypothetical protein